ncbi:MAG: hypothetical protein IPM29_15905 [Planctomycetes bacterium]|nr:hypothetical protein [Planctomycetota bacterium]
MLWDYLKAALGFAAVAAGWVAVQCAWRRVFPEAADEHGDVLAKRGSCGSCSCATPCESRREREAASAGDRATFPDFSHPAPKRL